MKFLLAPPPPPPKVIFVLKVVCPQYTFSLPDLGNCYSLVFQNACLNLDCYLPQGNRASAFVAPWVVCSKYATHLLQYAKKKILLESFGNVTLRFIVICNAIFLHVHFSILNARTLD